PVDGLRHLREPGGGEADLLGLGGGHSLSPGERRHEQPAEERHEGERPSHEEPPLVRGRCTGSDRCDVQRDSEAPREACQGRASTQNFGYRRPGGRSEVTVTNPGEEGSVTRASLREYASVQRARYARATRAEKRQLLDEIVAVTGIHRKAAIR